MRQIILTLFLIFLFIPSYSFAHGSLTVGRADHDGYVITLDAYVKLHTGEAQRLNFEIQKNSTTSEMTDVPYTDAWVRIAGPSDEILFTGNIIHAPDGIITGFSYLYPSPGLYEITLRFMDGDHVLTETPLHLTIAPGEKSDSITNHELLLIAAALAFGVIIGIGGTLLKTGVRHRTHNP